VARVHAIAVILVHVWPIVPPRVRLHAIVVSHALRRASNGAAHATTVVVTVAPWLLMAIVTLARVAVLVRRPSVVAAPPAVVSAHDIGLVGAHRLRPAAVLAINGGFEGLDGVERALPSRACGVGEIGVDWGPLDFGRLLQNDVRLTNGIALCIGV
jgi:hypothetical protein